MSGAKRGPGWDKRAVNEIANRDYGGLPEMFAAHGWTTQGRSVSQIAPTKIVESYGSIASFEAAHRDGRDRNPMLDPLAAFRNDPPEVFIKSFHGFTPESWGFLGYTKPSSRDKFVRESKPGALVVICATAKAANPVERLRVLGMQQQSHIPVSKWDYLDPARHVTERSDPDRARRWAYALKAVRAWRITPEERPFVRDIFPATHANGNNGTQIGSYGVRLQPKEAFALLDLNMIEVQVFGGPPVDTYLPAPALQVLTPSRPGPVSQTGYMVREAEGPKHLYVLRLEGDADALLGYDATGQLVVKVGFSCSPETRRAAHNKTLPACAFEWRMHHSSYVDGLEAFPSSGHALAGEQAMKDLLSKSGRSLGGEFFLASGQAVQQAWDRALIAAKNWKP